MLQASVLKLIQLLVIWLSGYHIHIYIYNVLSWQDWWFKAVHENERDSQWNHKQVLLPSRKVEFVLVWWCITIKKECKDKSRKVLQNTRNIRDMKKSQEIQLNILLGRFVHECGNYDQAPACLCPWCRGLGSSIVTSGTNSTFTSSKKKMELRLLFSAPNVHSTAHLTNVLRRRKARASEAHGDIRNAKPLVVTGGLKTDKVERFLAKSSPPWTVQVVQSEHGGQQHAWFTVQSSSTTINHPNNKR